MSVTKSRLHGIAPLQLNGETQAEAALDRLKRVVLAQPRTRLKEQDQNYLHFTFQSRLFRFVDDVKFLVDEDSGVVHFLSQSRSGGSDLGVNRKRMEVIRAAWNASETPSANG